MAHKPAESLLCLFPSSSGTLGTLTYVMLVVCYHKTAINYYRRSMSDSVLLGEGSVSISYLEIR